MTSMTHSDVLTKLAKSALVLAAETAWQDIALADLCAASDVTLVDCAKVSASKAHVAAQLDKNIDQAMLAAQSKIDRTQSVRDRLFDVLMSRFDAMEQNRASWESIFKAEMSDVMANLARRARRAHAGAWALEASGVTASDVRGAGRAIVLARILRVVETVWLEDGPDLAKTMARLDQELRTAEECVGRIEAVSSFLRPKSATGSTL